MTTTFEQPKRLTIELQRRSSLPLAFIQVVLGLFILFTVIVERWQTAKGAQPIPPSLWIVLSGGFLLIFSLIQLGLFLERHQRTYLELRDQGIYLKRRGLIRLHQFTSWSFVPDPINPHYTRVRFRYRDLIGRQRWSLLLDDPQQTEDLRQTLARLLPDKETKASPEK